MEFTKRKWDVIWYPCNIHEHYIAYLHIFKRSIQCRAFGVKPAISVDEILFSSLLSHWIFVRRGTRIFWIIQLLKHNACHQSRHLENGRNLLFRVFFNHKVIIYFTVCSVNKSMAMTKSFVDEFSRSPFESTTTHMIIKPGAREST